MTSRHKAEVEEVESVPKQEYIGHITTPIDEDDLEQVQAFCKNHGITMSKCQTDSNWWTLVFPNGGTKTLQEIEGRVPFYLIHLPNGHSFEYVPPIFKKDKTYTRLPKISVTQEPQHAKNPPI